MLVVVGLVIVLAAAIVGITGVLTNAGSAHLLTDDFAVLGYHVTGSTGTLLLYGIVVGVVAGVGFSMLLAGARRAASRGQDARRELKRSAQSDTATKEPVRDRGDAPWRGDVMAESSRNPDEADTGRRTPSLRERWSRRSTKNRLSNVEPAQTISTKTPHS